MFFLVCCNSRPVWNDSGRLKSKSLGTVACYWLHSKRKCQWPRLFQVDPDSIEALKHSVLWIENSGYFQWNCWREIYLSFPNQVASEAAHKIARKVPVNVAYGEGDPCCICFGAEDEALMKIIYFRGHERGEFSEEIINNSLQVLMIIQKSLTHLKSKTEVVGLHLWALWRPAFASFLADIRYMPAAIGASRTS